MKSNGNLDLLLRQVCKVHSNKVNKLLDGVGLHIGQPIMLGLLYEKGGLPQSVLAKEMLIKPATVSAMVKRLEKNGHVIRKRDSEDERVSNVYLTEKGTEVFAQLDGYQDTMEALVFDGFSEDEKKNMRDYLVRVLDNLAK
jgi:DNA-binding MarR family transcriptional regulator